jgi:hypothetical protein
MDVFRFVTVEAVEEEPIRPRNITDCWHTCFPSLYERSNAIVSSCQCVAKAQVLL